MKLLAIDTATRVAGAAVLSEERLICENIVDYKLKHSEKLMPTIALMLENSGLTYADIDVFAAATGPGSFTGLRIGLATVKGLAQACAKPVIAVSTLEALAYNLAYSDGLICPVLDARRNQVYTALFETDGSGRVARLTADSARSLEALQEILARTDRPVYLIGDGAAKFADALTSAADVRLVAPYQRMGHAGALAACALAHRDEARDLRDIAPVYLRPSYAEEKKKEKKA